jgi:hypothetical protein
MTELSETSREIELSTVYFYRGEVPQKLSLRDLNVPTAFPVQGALLGLHGSISKREGFMRAGEYATAHQLQFTVIDTVVRIAPPKNQLRSLPEDLPNLDFLALERITREMHKWIGQTLQGRLDELGIDQSDINASDPTDTLQKRPDLVNVLLDLPSWRHVKMMVFSASLAFSRKPLNIAAVPLRHWDAIVEANCRLDPTIHVTLEKPKRTGSSS